jgi:hypothetical protein
MKLIVPRSERVMKSSKKSAAPSDKVALYQQLVATNPAVELKGATHPYTALNGNMFSYLHPSGLMALRLPAGERDKFI